MKKMCIYIHIPFCKKRCMYCSFFSSPSPHNNIRQYIDALKNDIAAWVNDFDTAVSVYFGGGTPSCIPAQFIGEILQEIRNNYSIAADAEITLEANPDTITGKNADTWLDCGVNRFSIGLQSGNDTVLKAIGRIHTKEDFVAGIKILKDRGVKNISADIMLGLPYQTEQDVRHTLEILCGLDLQHISAYGLKVEPCTKLYDEVKSGKITLPSDDECADMYDIVYHTLKKQGMYRYEVSNFAKKGFECVHNLNYWERGEFAGLGVAAHSFIKEIRRENICNVEEYIKRGGINCIENARKITPEEAEFEYIMLRLRTTKGINKADFKKLFKEDFQIKYAAILNKLKDFFIIQKHSISISDKGFYVLNGILAHFAP